MRVNSFSGASPSAVSPANPPRHHFGDAQKPESEGATAPELNTAQQPVEKADTEKLSPSEARKKKAKALEEANRAALKKAVQELTKESLREVKPDEELKAAQTLGQLRQATVSELQDVVLKRKWLKHAFLHSENSDVIPELIQVFRQQLGSKAKVFELDLEKLSEGEVKLKDEDGKERKSDLNLQEMLIPPSAMEKQGFMNVLESLKPKMPENDALQDFKEILPECLPIEKDDNVVFLVKGIKHNSLKPENTPLRLMNTLDKLEKLVKPLAPNANFIFTPVEAPLTPQESLELMSTTGGGLFKNANEDVELNTIGDRASTIQLLTVDRLNANEWHRVLQDENSTLSKQVQQVLENYQVNFEPDALLPFVELVYKTRETRPAYEDFSAELDMLASSIKRAKPEKSSITKEDIRYYQQHEVKNRGVAPSNSWSKLFQFTPDPFKVVKHAETTFDDIVGHEEAKQAIKDVLDPDKRYLYQLLNKQNKSSVNTVLLSGPPGTGKTELAKAASGEHNGTFIYANAGDFTSSPYQAAGTTNVRRLMDYIRAAKSDTVVVYLDEIDSLGSRDKMGINSNKEDYKVLTGLLTGIQGADQDFGKTVLFMFSTNKPENLDPALLSRMQRQIFVDRPTQDDLKQIWQLHFKREGIELADDVDLDKLAKRSSHLVGRDINTMTDILRKRLYRRVPLDLIKKIRLGDLDPKSLIKIEAKQADLDAVMTQYKDEQKVTQLRQAMEREKNQPVRYV